MKHLLLAAAAALALSVPVLADDMAHTMTPGEIIEATKPSEWVAIAPSDLLVMDIAPDAKGRARRVVIQLMPAPFSQGWIGNIRKLAAAHWWNGTAITRVQDNYVVQWGDPNGEDEAKAKPLPKGLMKVPESDYITPYNYDSGANGPDINLINRRDAYASGTGFVGGWPVAFEDSSQKVSEQERKQDPQGGIVNSWPVHCYGMVGVGRNLAPDTGTGAELYTVIGQAPRHLDRNIAVVGRVISGMELLSSLPRGTGGLGVYEDRAQHVPITSIRLASELPAAQQPHFEYLSTAGPSFAKYAHARANRQDQFFIRPAGGADVCNIPVPVRTVISK